MDVPTEPLIDLLNPLRIFVGVSSSGLELERQAVEQALAELPEKRFVNTEYVGRCDRGTPTNSLHEISTCKFYIGIVGNRYDSEIDQEYRCVIQLGLPCLIYEKADSTVPAATHDPDVESRRKLQTFLNELRAKQTVRTFFSTSMLVEMVLTDIHRWLFRVQLIERYEAEHDKTDSHAKVVLDKIRDLETDFATRLTRAGVSAEGPRSIAIGGSAIQSILVTGNHNHVFAGNYQRLAEEYIKPWPVFERVRLTTFTGRQWLTRQIDDFFAKHDRGYIIIEAPAGLGKTAYLAHLAKERGYIHHFVELSRGQAGVEPGLRSLAAQLATAWNIEPYYSDDALPAAASRRDFLQTILKSAAQRRDLLSPNENIVLVVDGLDESAAPDQQNVMGLPEVLPPQVFLIVSHRPVHLSLHVETYCEVIRIDPKESHNLTDVREFLDIVADRPIVQVARLKKNYSKERFVVALTAKSGGVWVYLYYVIAEIERANLLDLDALPDGLWAYYFRFWQRKSQEQIWDSVYLPLLSTLAAVQTDIGYSLLCKLAGMPDSVEIKQTLERQWRPYLLISGSEPASYRLYHESLRDFLSGRVPRRSLTTAEQEFADHLATATVKANDRIATLYLDLWGGLATGLPGLEDPRIRDVDQRYGLHYIARHLNQAGRAVCHQFGNTGLGKSRTSPGFTK